MIDIDRLRTCLDDAETAEPWLRTLCVADLPAARSVLTAAAWTYVAAALATLLSVARWFRVFRF